MMYDTMIYDTMMYDTMINYTMNPHTYIASHNILPSNEHITSSNQHPTF